MPHMTRLKQERIGKEMLDAQLKLDALFINN